MMVMPMAVIHLLWAINHDLQRHQVEHSLFCNSITAVVEHSWVVHDTVHEFVLLGVANDQIECDLTNHCN